MGYLLVPERIMKNNFLIIPDKIYEKKSPNVSFLFPLKGLCVGFKKVYELKDIKEGSYVYINRILDTEGILYFKSILPKMKHIKGIVFEDLGIIEILKKENASFELILYATHACCSLYTTNAYLDYVDSVVLSLDITKEETEIILAHATKKVCLYTYGPICYMYSRRTLLKNYQEHFGLEKEPVNTFYETNTKSKFVLIENEYGTVCYDELKIDGRVFLNHENVYFHLINLDWDEINSLDSWLEDFVNDSELENVFSGFLDQKTIYRLEERS